MTKTKVAILGAGMAGLNLARRLDAGGIEVQLFEKARGPSGRLSTRRAEVGQFDHGAQYLTARDAGFQSQVDEWVARGIIAPWEGRLTRIASATDESGDSAPSPEAKERYVGRPRMSAIARDLLGDRAIEVGVRIESASRDGDGWRLRSEAGKEYHGFDALLLAVPPQQAVPFLECVPRVRDRVAEIRMLPCHAVMARFCTPVETGFDGAFVDDAALSWVSLDSSKPGREVGGCWLLHSQAEWSDANVDLPSEDVIDGLLDAFARALGRPLPEREFAASHRWLYARTEKPLGEDSIWDTEQAIGVCGDWLRGDRVEDAYLSGERLAERVLASRLAR